MVNDEKLSEAYLEAAEDIVGKENISGRLPISIPGMYEIGSGLFLEKRVDVPIVKKFEPGKLLLRVRSRDKDLRKDA